MAPKKKGGKKQADDWEAELGETIDPIAEATEAAKKAEQAEDAADDAGAAPGGLLAALRKNKDKRAKKGKTAPNDFVDGEDPDAAISTPPATDLDAKAPTEATFDDEDDIFSGPIKKGKGGKKAEQPAEPADKDEEEGGLKSKKEKEREKKEREKARKKEQVRVYKGRVCVRVCVLTPF